MYDLGGLEGRVGDERGGDPLPANGLRHLPGGLVVTSNPNTTEAWQEFRVAFHVGDDRIHERLGIRYVPLEVNLGHGGLGIGDPRRADGGESRKARMLPFASPRWQRGNDPWPNGRMALQQPPRAESRVGKPTRGIEIPIPESMTPLD